MSFLNPKLIHYHESDKKTFIELVENELSKRFNTVLDNLPENYGRYKEWGLLNLLDKGLLDSYSLLYYKEQCWSGAGGRLVNHDGKQIYQGLFRLFSNASDLHHSLGMKSFSYEFILPIQLERAKLLNCHSLVISFNATKDYEKLYSVIKIFPTPPPPANLVPALT
jgi:hypothetical protein